MKPARLVILGVALVAGVAAAYLATGRKPPPAPAPVAAAPAQKTEDVLVAAVDVPMGNGLKAADLRWQAWPEDGVPKGAVTRAASPNAMEDVSGAIARTAILAGEPVRHERLIKADGSGFMSAILPTGKRAIAISIDNRGASSAGGFILPNDHVDVIRTYRDEEASKQQGVDVTVAETVLTNIRVLAIGQTVQEKDGEKVVTGETATLEVDPGQAEVLTLAQKVGQISLALRSLADANDTGSITRGDDGSLTIVRFGVPVQTPRR
ncbi:MULTISPECIES: Flp pilus assembly protein CpaB [Chelatococcus]|uniref:Pilus assembly protein CpaB n=1 Tax=Chelatococcus caeni TaxID=1348468 RepID=A0A840C124_9HYPH|nr:MULTISPECIES: Flp pilus assembly protein CpaB [Chelatococcus]ALA17057.1 pilus assembly protein CpaB [Chelatococcus sp. CO-6]MBB4017209.1 pilus assembly protein CpaB [Chelatococcus caeni]